MIDLERLLSVPEEMNEMRALLQRLEARINAIENDRLASLTVKEAAAHLNQSEKTIRRRIERGDLKWRKEGRAVRIDLSSRPANDNGEEAYRAARQALSGALRG